MNLWVEYKKVCSKFIAPFTRKSMRILIREFSYTIMKFFLIELAVERFRTHLSCSSNFPRASYLDERTADVWINCFITFSTRWFKCCKGVNIPSATLQRVGNFVSGNISSSSAGSQLSMFSLNSRRSLNQFLIVKSQSKKIVEKIFFYRRICLRMSWACTIRIWSTLTQLNLIKQIYALCYNVRQCSS